MKATEVLRLAQQAGIEMVADGGHLRMRAKTPPPAGVIDTLRRHKIEILALLSPAATEWSPQDWRLFFDKRASKAKSVGRLSQIEAEARAFEACVVEWLNRNPEPSPPGGCARCRRPPGYKALVVPFGVGDRHTWLHPGCWHDWHKRRRKKAARALSRFGVKGSEGRPP